MLTRISTLATVAIVGVLGLGAASADSRPTGQVTVAGVPEEVFGLAADASVRSTIPVEVNRERIGNTTICTVTPRD
jgi:hypothetical protein